MWLEMQESNIVDLLVFPDARLENRESRIDTLADQLSSLTFLLKTGKIAAVPSNST